MALDTLTNQPKISVFSDEDRADHLRKQVERTFGVALEELGTVEQADGVTSLLIRHNDRDRRLTWRRGAKYSINWFLDGGEKPIKLSGGNNPLQRLRDALDY